MRYPRGTGPGAPIHQALDTLPIGKAELRRRGHGLALLSFGAMLAPAATVAAELDATLVNMRFVKPLDEALILELAKSHDAFVTLEDNAIAGGAGSAVAECLAAHGITLPILHLGLPDVYLEHGSREEVLSHGRARPARHPPMRSRHASRSHRSGPPTRRQHRLIGAAATDVQASAATTADPVALLQILRGEHLGVTGPVQQGAARLALVPAVLEQQPATGGRDARGASCTMRRMSSSPSSPEASALAGSKRRSPCPRCGSAASMYGGLETISSTRSTCQRRQPVAVQEAHVGNAQALRIAPGHRERLVTGIGGDHAGQRPLAGDRQGDGAAAGAQVDARPRLLSGGSRSSASSTSSSVSGRGISVAGVTSSSSDQKPRRPVI